MTKKSIDRLAKDLGRKRLKPTKEQVAAYRRAVREHAAAYAEHRDVIESQTGGSLVSDELRGAEANAKIASTLSDEPAGVGPWGYRHDLYCGWCGCLQSCNWTWREIIDVLSGRAPMLLPSKGVCGHKTTFACNVGRDEVLLSIQKGWTTVEENGQPVDLSNDLLAALVVK